MLESPTLERRMRATTTTRASPTPGEMTLMRIAACVLGLMASLSVAAENETFHGWSKDGSWLVFELHVDDERSELYFCATDPEGQPSWPASLHDAERETVGELACVRFIDPNKAPYQWKAQLVLPRPAERAGAVSVAPELSTIGDQGFVLEAGQAAALLRVGHPGGLEAGAHLVSSERQARRGAD